MRTFFIYSPYKPLKISQHLVTPFTSVAVGECMKSDDTTHLSSHTINDTKIDFKIDITLREPNKLKTAEKENKSKLKTRFFQTSYNHENMGRLIPNNLKDKYRIRFSTIN